MALLATSELSGRDLILVGIMADADRDPAGVMGDYSGTRAYDSFICFCKYTYDGKIYY